jgi:hypothetical protein
VVVQRHGEQWIVHCGSSHALSANLDLALTQAIHAETDLAAHAQEFHYPTWIRTLADKLNSEADLGRS